MKLWSTILDVVWTHKMKATRGATGTAREISLIEIGYERDKFD